LAKVRSVEDKVRAATAPGLRGGEALLKDGRRLLEQLYAQAELSVPDNASRPGEKSHPSRKFQMHSIFGVVELRRHYFYSPASGRGRFPLDEALGLVESFSPAEKEKRVSNGVAFISKKFVQYGLTTVHHSDMERRLHQQRLRS